MPDIVNSSLLYLTLVVCFIATTVFIWAYKRIALKLLVVDVPNNRSAHVEPTPTGAGIVFVVVFYLGLMAFLVGGMSDVDLLLVLLAPMSIALLGFADDVRHVGWPVRATLHFLAAGWCIYLVGFPILNILGSPINLGLAGIFLGVLSLVWLLNLYNFMDGVDGIAASEILFIVLAALVIGQCGDRWSYPLLLLIVVIFPFLIFNWPKATVFMGDAGSGFLGLLLGILILDSDIVSVWTWLILSACFITDACLTISVRLLRGQPIWIAHSQHAYQHLGRWIGAKKTLSILVATNFIWLMPMAALSEAYSGYGLVLLVLSGIPLLAAEFFLGAGQVAPGLGRDKASG